MLDQRKIQPGAFNFNLDEIYGMDGKLSSALDGFVERPQQKEMAESIRKVFTNGENLIVEAGTGTGKSLAYLIPAARFAFETENTVIISTFTINLQEQLENSDIPLTQNVLDDDPQTALVKGRTNYLCPARLKKAWEERHLRFADDRKEKQLERLLEWSRETDDGSRSDLNFTVHGDVWNQVCSKRGICRCIKKKNTKCFYARTWKKLQAADILLVNHHLFMQDLAMRMDSGFGLLPKYGAVVLDEAHHMEQVARQCLGLELSYLQFKYLRRDLFHPEKETGLLTVIGAEELSEKVNRMDREAEAFFNTIRTYHSERADDEDSTLRIYESGFVPNTLDPVLSDLLKGLRNKTETGDLDDDDADEVKSMINRITGLKQGLDLYLEQKDEDDVYWLERSNYRDNVTLRSSPVDVSETLRDNFFEPVHASVLTSATLTTSDENPFGYVRNRVGLNGARTLHLGHPFDYRHQVTLRLVSDMTSPSEDSEQFTSDVTQWLRNHFEKTDGQTFVLFTSYRMLNTVADRLRGQLEKQGVRLLVQGGDLSRRRMLNEFRTDQPAIIFGADAFWEGVDIRGNNLSHVIITKLPFPNPADPLVEATSEKLEEEDQNPFTDYFLPEAVLSLKQGFGRLIRSREDSGEISILDSRILRKFYGHHFLDALPDCKTIHESLDDTVSRTTRDT